jgi:protein gp37
VNRTKIDWCDYTWNPVWGCLGDCPYCYARKMARRLGDKTFLPRWMDKNFERKFPRKPSRIFVNSMSDVAYWQKGWMMAVRNRINEHPEHLFLFLTKYPERVEWVPMDNAMLGYTITRQWDYDRLMKMSDCRKVSFFSIEPIMQPIRLGTYLIPKWIIVGAETGNRKARVMPDRSWLKYFIDYADVNNVPLFFKKSLWAIWPVGEGFPQEYPARQLRLGEGME